MPSRKVITSIIVSLFIVYTIWWINLAMGVSPEDEIRGYYSDTYGILAGFGGVVGLWIAGKWGGWKSFVGKSVLLFSFGLLVQFLGQLSYSLEYYIYGIENSYPSIGEVFFLSSIPAYILAVWYIGKAAGSSISLKKIENKLGAVILPILMMGISYYFFVYGNSISEMPFIEKVLFIAYPLGQAIFVSFAAIAYYLTGSILGGVMQKRVVFILFSLIFQYIADTLFLYRTTVGTWYPADISEYMFVASYFLMALALVDFWSAAEKLRKSK